MPKPSSRKKRLSMDAITISDEAVEDFVGFLKEKLEPKDFAELKKMIGQGEQSDDEDEPESASDEPPPFKGAPRTGGAMAADASSDARFNAMFPDSARIKVWL